MTSVIGGLAIGIVVLIVAVKWLFEDRNVPGSGEPDIDYDELSEAEREVRELGSSVDPDDADKQMRDWGPGAPR